MNNQEYIRAAVELADGWEMFEGGPCILGVCIGSIEPSSKWQPIMLAALAAQLIEQVDATDYDIRVFSHSTMIFHGGHEFRTVSNDGRDMNTIKVVVDSGGIEK